MFGPKLSYGRWETGLEYTKAQGGLPYAAGKETWFHRAPGMQIVFNKWLWGAMSNARFQRTWEQGSMVPISC